MKRYLYPLCFVIGLVGLNACNKSNDPAPASPVVGRWQLNRGILSGFPAGANVNGAALDLYYFESLGSTIDVYSDNTFNENYRNVTVDDGQGTWDFTNDRLTLKYDGGGEETYAYTKTKNVEELAATAPINYTLTIPTSQTSSAAAVGKLQFVYRK